MLTTKGMITKARGRLIEIGVTLLVSAVIAVTGFSLKAYAEENFVMQEQFAQYESRRELGDIADSIKEIDYKIRAATLDMQASTARNDTVGTQRSQADVLYFTQEKDTLLREREELLKGGPAP